ncbi:Fanconi anemia group M protein [Spodoptera litura]|uniref:Fanconi anemia group M protein n=1 Tax=Spodoptera litura TaxID=69820 RepID=A0A9J7E8B2_SPOLT|nr:Fanconi anemia group M protein [Spodoptera litura]XP_022825022.1 Fanconi anemia group M protein [Spodoptera litura]XP_022825023.1 Fanconi anemia group M protein [Spodoptera litura]
MNNLPSTSKSKQNDGFEDDEIFEDSSLLADFDNSFVQRSKFSESNLNDSRNKSGLNISALCCDEEISGYDKLTGKTWIYPTNYPVRDYQFNVIRAAILQNTLVSLPTGLGKTFIAAVIMYNFYRWYPLGKIVFTAPTRPLVAQQIDACYNIIAIPPNDTIEMTGHMQVNTRKEHWKNKRVFFATPQVIYNDMKSGICPCDKIRCLVIDEAHRARGNYAYCQIVSTLDDVGHKTYRILALSATPGSKVEDVINVVKNLHIAHLELRTENCIDVAPYSHARKIKTVVLELGFELTQLRQQYIEILDGYARRLKQMNILPPNLGNLSKGRIVMLYKEYQTKDRSLRHPQHNYIMKDFTILIALYHGLELLVQHGSRIFLNFFDEHPEKSWMQADDRLTALLERLRDDLGVNPLSLDRSILPDGTIPEMPKDLTFGHPKFDKLKEIMTYHFAKAQQLKQDTRAIVFCEYRESVNLVHCLLLQCRPLIKPMMFVGQGASGKDGKTIVSQKQQLRVMRSFREGQCNVLVATCVAEEGLDVGSVDLIICFDISTKSPVRLVQRCGRTGRERGGEVFILVTEGREHQTLIECMRQRDGLNKKVLQSKEVENNLYKLNPRMIPHDFMPQCQKMYITVEKKQDPKEKVKEGIDKAKKGQKDLRAMLARPSTSTSSRETDSKALITEDEFKELFPEGYSSTSLFAKRQEYWAMSRGKLKDINTTDGTELKLSNWLEWQRTLQTTVNVQHSRDAEILAELLQYSDAKRFDMPVSTQNPCFGSQELRSQPLVLRSPAKNMSPAKTNRSPAKINKQTIKKKQKLPLTKPQDKKDGDIRALFSTATKSTKNYTKLISDLGLQTDSGVPTRLISLLVDLTLENTNTNKNCYVCQNICACNLLKSKKEDNKLPMVVLESIKQPRLPDIYLIDDFDAETIMKCMKKSDEDDDDVNMDNFDLGDDFLCESPVYGSPIEEDNKKDVVAAATDNFDIGDIDDIFANSSPEEAIEKEIDKNDKPVIKAEERLRKDEVLPNKPELFTQGQLPQGKSEVLVGKGQELQDKSKMLIRNDEEPKEAKDTLGFFGLDSIDDIFADDEIDNTPPEPTQNKTKDKPTQNTKINRSPSIQYPLSPSILSGRVKLDVPTSPILCSQPRKFQLSTKKNRSPNSILDAPSCRKQLIQDSTHNNLDMAEQSESSKRASLIDTSNKSLMTITQLVEMINKTGNESTSITNASNRKQEKERSLSPILLTQAEKRSIIHTNSIDRPGVSTNALDKSIASTSITKDSLIVLDSDSDSDGTQVYDVTEYFNTNNNSKIHDTNISPMANKRKRDLDDSEVITASPYFNKKQKLDNETAKEITLQERVLAVMKKNKNKIMNNDKTVLNCVVSQGFLSQKENKNPQLLNGDADDEKRDEQQKQMNLSMLQMFRRENKVQTVRNKFSTIFKTPKSPLLDKRKIAFEDSDDDFEDDKNFGPSNRTGNKMDDTYRSTTNHKVRKKKNKNNDFLDLEAVLTDEEDHSGDELSDESIGSIVDFICDDDNTTHHEDIQAVYLKSVKSPVRGGGFKIPELPKRFNKEDILSQYVEEDSYEMDSFCVDSNIGLTQGHEISELELAEMKLEAKRKAKKKFRRICSQEESPDMAVVKKNKPKRRLIESDSEDSS